MLTFQSTICFLAFSIVFFNLSNSFILFEYLIQKYSNKKGIISAKELKALKKQIQNTIDLKEKSISEFLKFYEETETRLKDLYNADLRMWKEYNNVETLYDNSEENLNSVQREIEIYEKKLEERANAYDEFLFYYDDLSKEEQEEYIFEIHQMLLLYLVNLSQILKFLV